MTRAEDGLKLIRAHGKKGYESYRNHSPRRDSRTLVITPVTYPDVLRLDPSIYPRQHLLDSLTKKAAEFYRNRGMEVMISGPQGLGAGGIFDQLYWNIINAGTFVMHWLNAHSLTTNLAKLILPVAQSVKAYVTKSAERHQKKIRQTKPRVQLNLTLYVKDGSEQYDLTPYAQ